MNLDPDEIKKKILNLSPTEQREVVDFIVFLESKKETGGKKKKLGFNWMGELKELRDKYTSVELQHKIDEWRI